MFERAGGNCGRASRWRLLGRPWNWVLGLTVGVSLLQAAPCDALTVKEAKTLSRQTGRPILAVAGRASCPHCTALVKELQSNRGLAPLVSVFVPLQLSIDENPAIWNKWRKQYGSPGRSTPLVYVIGANNKKLATHSGALRGNALVALLRQSLSKAGRVYTPAQAKELASLAAKVKQALTRNQPDAASQLLRSAKLGPAGTAGSQAQPAIELDRLTQQLTQTAKRQLQATAAQLQAEPNLEAAFDFALLIEWAGDLPQVKSEVAKTQRDVEAKPELQQLLARATPLVRARLLSNHSRTAATAEQRLERLAASEDLEVAKLARRELQRLAAGGS